MKNKLLLTLFAFCFLGLFQVQSQNTEEAMMGEIKLFAGNFPPRGWMFCEGQMLPIAQNSTLFSILDTTFGGNGRTTFALPDLRGRIPVGVNQRNDQGLTRVRRGQKFGNEKVAIRTDIPSYRLNNNDEDIRGKTVVINVGDEQTATKSSIPGFYAQPSLGIHYIICVEGKYPSRN